MTNLMARNISVLKRKQLEHEYFDKNTSMGILIRTSDTDKESKCLIWRSESSNEGWCFMIG